MSKPVYSESRNGMTINIYFDEFAEQPFQNKEVEVEFFFFHKRYSLSQDQDRHGFKSSDFESWEEMEEAILRKFRPKCLLPVYMYDHSGLSISTSPFGCRFDSGQVGFVFVPSDSDVDGDEKAKTICEDLVHSIDMWLSGNCWGYEIIDTDGSLLDACWSFVCPMEECLQEARDRCDQIFRNNPNKEHLKETSA